MQPFLSNTNCRSSMVILSKYPGAIRAEDWYVLDSGAACFKIATSISSTSVFTIELSWIIGHRYSTVSRIVSISSSSPAYSSIAHAESVGVARSAREYAHAPIR